MWIIIKFGLSDRFGYNCLRTTSMIQCCVTQAKFTSHQRTFLLMSLVTWQQHFFHRMQMQFKVNIVKHGEAAKWSVDMKHYCKILSHSQWKIKVMINVASKHLGNISISTTPRSSIQGRIAINVACTYYKH